MSYPLRFWSALAEVPEGQRGMQTAAGLGQYHRERVAEKPCIADGPAPISTALDPKQAFLGPDQQSIAHLVIPLRSIGSSAR